jgi:tRNA (cytidine/uridine-2'-O-)-methyltransferase
MLHVVLYEPQIPPNTGNIIRLCANTGATLHLIEPLGFRLDDKSLRRSGLDYHDLADLLVHPNLQECLDRLAASRWFAVETGARSRYTEFAYRDSDAFFFGPETRGLPAGVVARLGSDRSITVPMRPASRSLNLSNAVAVVVYEAWRQMNFAGRGEPAGGDEVVR